MERIKLWLTVPGRVRRLVVAAILGAAAGATLLGEGGAQCAAVLVGLAAKLSG